MKSSDVVSSDNATTPIEKTARLDSLKEFPKIQVEIHNAGPRENIHCIIYVYGKNLDDKLHNDGIYYDYKAD